MIARLILSFSLLLLASACSQSDRIPGGIYSRQDMEDVLWDMMRVDRYSSLYLSKDSARLSVIAETFKLYEKVFRAHHTTKDEFVESFRFYLKNRPDLVRSIFDSISARAVSEKEGVYKSLH